MEPEQSPPRGLRAEVERDLGVVRSITAAVQSD